MPDTDKGDGQTADAGQAEKTVPLAALEAEREKRQAFERQLAEMRGELNALKTIRQDKPPDKPKEYSKSELLAAVKAGSLSQADADAIYERQYADKIKREATAEIEAKFTQRMTDAEALNAIGQYRETVPELAAKGSDAWNKVKAIYDRMVGRGAPETYATELSALEAAYGEAGKLKQAKQGQRETIEEGSGGSGGDTGTGINKDGTPKGLSARERAHYSKLIDRGIYKGWADVESERKWQRKGRAA